MGDTCDSCERVLEDCRCSVQFRDCCRTCHYDIHYCGCTGGTGVTKHTQICADCNRDSDHCSCDDVKPPAKQPHYRSLLLKDINERHATNIRMVTEWVSETCSNQDGLALKVAIDEESRLLKGLVNMCMLEGEAIGATMQNELGQLRKSMVWLDGFIKDHIETLQRNLEQTDQKKRPAM